MVRFSLACYAVRVRLKHSEVFEPLHAFGNGSDFLDVFRRYINQRTAGFSLDQNAQKLLRVNHSQIAPRRVSGIIETGEYGYESRLYDIDTSSLSYHRTITDAEMIPYYFLLNVPMGQDEGIIILQRRAQFGIRTVLFSDFRQYFVSRHPDYILSINQLVPQSVIDEIQSGTIKKVRLIRYEMPDDLADAYEEGGHREHGGTLELSLTASRDNGLPLLGGILDVMSGRRGVTRLVELRDFPYDNAKVEIDLGGRRRTIDLSDTGKLRAYVDVTDDLELANNGHPTFPSVDASANDLLQSLLSQMGVGG